VAVERYRAGATTREIAKTFGIHHERIGKVLRDAGVRLRRSGMTDIEIDEAVLLYEQGWSLAPIGAKLGSNALTVRDRLRERGVRIRAPHERVR